jgi:hypothetical protein
MSATLATVLAELDRLDTVPAVANDSGRPNSFDTGARWTIRMIREAIERDQLADAVARLDKLERAARFVLRETQGTHQYIGSLAGALVDVIREALQTALGEPTEGTDR